MKHVQFWKCTQAVALLAALSQCSLPTSGETRPTSETKTDTAPPKHLVLSPDSSKASLLGAPGLGLEVTKADFEYLAGNKKIHHIELHCVWIDESGLRLITNARNIETISLVKCNISDKGVDALSQSGSIKKIQISSAMISGHALSSIGRMEKISMLSVYNCPLIGDAAWRTFRKSRPDIEVTTDMAEASTP